MVLAVCSGLGIALAFPPTALTLTIWVALVPLLFAAQSQPLNRVFRYAWIQGLVFFAATLYWLFTSQHDYGHLSVTNAGARTLIVCAVEALFIAAAVGGAVFVTRRTRVPIWITLPIAWPAIEWLRGFFPLGFPWGLLGYAAYRDLRLIQFAEFTGVYGVSALIVLVNAAIYTALARAPSRREKTWAAAFAATSVICALIFGSFRINQLEGARQEGSLRIAMVQGDIPQSYKWNPAMVAPSFKVYSDASQWAAREHADLIIWPETAAAFLFQPNLGYPAGFRLQAEYRLRTLRLARALGQPLLIGAPALENNHGDASSRNRAYLISPQGLIEAWYDKNLLVPFSEYVPLKPVFGRFLHPMVESPVDLAPGTGQTIFAVGGAKLAVLICYESIFPDFTRRAIKAGANILVNLSNDAWFGRSSAPYQLFAMAAMRAVENHTPLVRVNNTGISGVVAPTGRIMGATAIFTRTTRIETVSWRRTSTFYSEHGDLFAELCAALTIIGLAAATLAPRR